MSLQLNGLILTNKALIMKQLKKSNFLEVVTEAPMTREQLVDALDGYEFIGSWLDYLTDHFENQGKIIKNEDGTIQRKAKKGGSSGPRKAFIVQENEDGSYSLDSKELEAGEALDKEAGWATTEARAIKNATSAVFQAYQASVAEIKALATPAE